MVLGRLLYFRFSNVGWVYWIMFVFMRCVVRWCFAWFIDVWCCLWFDCYGFAGCWCVC